MSFIDLFVKVVLGDVLTIRSGSYERFRTPCCGRYDRTEPSSSGPHLLPLHDHRLRQRVVAALLIGEALQIIQLCLELENEILLFFPLSLQALPLLPLTLTGGNTDREFNISRQTEPSDHTVTDVGFTLALSICNIVGRYGVITCGMRHRTHQILLQVKHATREKWQKKSFRVKN